MNRKILMMLALIGLSAGMANAQTNGICGDSLTWSLTDTESDLTLTISGTGDMYNYRNNAPWHSQRRKIKTLVLHNGMTSIGNYAFGLCDGVASVTIPNSVKTIGMGAFSFCFGLTSVTIPNSVTSVGKDAFAMSGIKDVYVSWTPSPPAITIPGLQPLIRIPGSSANNKVTLHVPQGALAAYQNARWWKNFNIVEDVSNTE